MTETVGEVLQNASAIAEDNLTPEAVDSPVLTESEPVEEVVESKPDEESVDENIADEVVEEDKTPASVNKRLNKMYAEKRAAEEKAQLEAKRSFELEQRLLQMQGGQSSGNSSVSDPYAPKEPNESDPKYASNPRAYIKDCVQYERDVLLYHSRQNQVQQQQNRLMQEHSKRIASAHERYPDYEEKIANLDSIRVTANNQQTVAALSATLMGLDNSADVLYYLSSNLEEAQELLGNNPLKAAANLGRISAKLERHGESGKRSAAPPPPKKIKGQGSTTVPNTWNNISVDDLAKRLRRTF